MSIEARRSVKSLSSDAWKRRLRVDVLERVRVQRSAILTKARGDADGQNYGLRQILDNGLREALHDAIGVETRRRESHENTAPESSDDGMWDDDVLVTRGVNNSNVTSTSKESRLDSNLENNSNLTWNEIAALSFTGVEYDELMAELHRGFEEELAEEEAYLLALELEKMETQEVFDIKNAFERNEAIEKELQSSSACDDKLDVLCPVCKERRLLQSKGSIFCPCENIRISRRDPTSEGNDGRVTGSDSFSLETVRQRLAESYALHANNKCGGSLNFEMKNFSLGDSTDGMLCAECMVCGLTEVVM